MRTYRQASPNLFGPRTDSEGWAHLADGLRGPVQTQRDSIRMLDTNELERLSRGIFKKCVNSQAVYPLSEQHGLEAQERR